jgi:type IV pilus assembly protein PilY1
VCNIVTVVDPTSETGYRDIQVCNNVQTGTQQQCTSYEQLPVFAQVCTSYEQLPVYGQQCVQTQQQQTGTTQQCTQWSTVPVYQDQCVQWQQVQVQDTCAATDPNWTCPPQNITTDNLTPARYYRYEGPVPATDDNLAVISSYRLVEVDRAVNQNFPVPVDPRTGAARTRTDCAAGTSCTRLEEMQNYANWFTYYRHRLFAAMAVTSQAASDLKGDLSALRLGYGRINYFDNGPDPWNPYGARMNGATFPSLDNDPSAPAHPGAVVRGVRDFTDTPGNPDRQQFFDWIFSLNWVGSTPNREAVDSIGTYYTNPSDFGPWSDNPGVGGGRSGDEHAACRRSFTILATDGEWTAIPDSPPIPPAQPLITNRPANPVGGGGTVTASLATTGPQMQGAGLYQGVTYNYDPAVEVQYSTGNGGVTQTLTDVALYWWNRDLRSGVPNAVQKRPSRPDDSYWQSVTTFIVGYGLNASMDTPAVRAQIAAGQAVNWPVVDISPALISGGERINDSMRAAMATRGDFYSANDPDQMRGRIRGVFRAIAQQAFSGTGLGSTSAQLTAGTTLYRASFTTQVWTGDLKAFDAIAMATAARNQQPEPAPLWSASFPNWNQRNLFTSIAPNIGLPFNTFGSLNAQQQADLTSADVMDYVRGKQVGLEVNNPDQNGNTLGFRARSTILGSIVSSTPRHSKAPNFNYQLLPAAGGGSTYQQFVNNNRANRRAAVYVGSNDGIFHAFDANPDPNQGGGLELFGYIPRSAYPFLKELIDLEYTHRYFVDGPVVEGDVYLNGNWKNVVMSSSGAGVAGLFALDVTQPEQFNPSRVLWDITSAEEPDLGKVMGHSYIGSVKWGLNGGKWVALVPNGYQSANNRAVLLVIDMETGQTLKKIDTCKKNTGVDFAANEQGGRCDPANAINGLANVSVIFDASRNIVGAYSGDYQGNLWKFDLSSSDSNNWRIDTEDPIDQSGNTPAPLFSAVNGSNQPQPITAVPRAATHPLGGSYVVFGTGKFFEYSDQTNTDVQSIYGLWVRPGDKAPITKAQLQVFGFNETVVNNLVTRTLTGTAGFSWGAKLGWYVDMVPPAQAPAGERVIANPSIDRGVLYMVSFQPSSTSDPCAGGGTSFIYVIPMDARVSGVKATQINGVIGGAMDLVEEEMPVAQPSNVLSLQDAAQAPNMTRRTDHSHNVADRDLQCMKLFSQINVKTGHVPMECGGVFPIRTWRPIR